MSIELIGWATVLYATGGLATAIAILVRCFSVAKPEIAKVEVFVRDELHSQEDRDRIASKIKWITIAIATVVGGLLWPFVIASWIIGDKNEIQE